MPRSPRDPLSPPHLLRGLLLAASLVVAGLAAGGQPVLAALAPVTPLPVQSQEPTQQAAPRAARRTATVAIVTDGLPDARSQPRGQFPADRIVLDLFPDRSVVAVFDHFDPNTTGTTWVGHVEGVAGSTVTLVYGDGLLTGGIATPTATYTIRPAPVAQRNATPLAAGVLHIVTEADQSGMRPESEPIEIATPRSARLGADATTQADTGDFIDLMVLYTPAGAAQAGGTAAMVALINLGVSETNTAYANSAVTQRVRLAHVGSVAYTETGSISTDLTALTSGSGAFSGVGALRDTYAADLVMLVESSSGASCGIANLMSVPSAGFASAAFSIVQQDCISPNYSFAHELGHNMGLRHDWYMDSSTTPYTYAHGHVSTTAGNRWRSIMSYNDLCTAQGFTCPRLLYWSNPGVTRGGAPMGVPAGTSSSCSAGSLAANTCDADDHLALNNTALVVANFRQAAVPGTPGPFSKTSPADGAVAQGVGVSLTWQSSAGATSYAYCYDATDDGSCSGSWTSVGNALSASVGGLNLATTYYWQVRATNGIGATDANGGIWWTFSTAGVVSAIYDAALGVPRCTDVGAVCDSVAALVGRASISGGPEPHQPNTLGGTCSDGTNGAFHNDESLDRLRVSTLDGQAFAPGKTVRIDATVWAFSSAGDALDLYYTATPTAPVWTFLTTLVPSSSGLNVLSATYALPPGSLQAIRGQFRFQGAATSACATPSGYDDHDDLVFTVGAAANTNIAANGTFTSGLTSWQQFATPNLTYLVSNVVGGVLQFYRAAPPPGSSNQAVVFQQTGVPAAAFAPLVAQFDLGNTDTVRKRISVLMHDSDFSDLAVCTFWLPPSAPLRTYSMRTHSTKPWANTALSFYAASENDAGNTTGFYQLDNVSVQYAPANASTDTTCVDPTTPVPPGGAMSADLLINGDFTAGVAPGWTTFGQISGAVTSGVFEFIALEGAPTGVVLQPTNQTATANQILTATFQLGNSSSVRKRVTVILHDNAFGDLSACTFWLAPGQPLSTYTYRTFATQAWANATLSVYPATVGAETWIRLDNATLRFTPAAALSGTSCVEPGGVVP